MLLYVISDLALHKMSPSCPCIQKVYYGMPEGSLV